MEQKADNFLSLGRVYWKDLGLRGLLQRRWILLFFFQVLFSFILLFWFRFLAISFQIIFLQLLLQSLFKTQFFLRQQVQVRAPWIWKSWHTVSQTLA